MSLEQKLEAALKSHDRAIIEKVFEMIYEEYHGLISFCIAQYLRDELDIEEVCDDVFLNFFNHLKENKFTSIKYYLVQSAKNLSLNKVKTKQKEIPLPENYDVISDDDPSCIKEDTFIHELKKRLSKEEFFILTETLLYDKTSKEIGEELSLNPATVRKKYSRCLQRIRKELGDKYHV